MVLTSVYYHLVSKLLHSLRANYQAMIWKQVLLNQKFQSLHVMVGQKATMGFYPSTGAQIYSLSSLLILCMTTRPPVRKRELQMMTIKEDAEEDQ